MPMDARDKQKLVDDVPLWFHSIDLGDGVVAPGTKSQEQLRNEWAAMELADLEGKSVLDIGAWDGFFSFSAERAGARRVMAMDHFVWSLDLAALDASQQRRITAGLEPLPPERVAGAWDPGRLPGKRGFDTAHRILGSRVEQVVGDYRVVNPDEIGSFDVVLYLGVLYHMADPIGSLRRLALLTREMAVIETDVAYFPELEEHALFQFFGGSELNVDPTNWFSPNRRALVDACVSAGFRSAEIIHGYPPPGDLSGPGPFRARCMMHAYK